MVTTEETISVVDWGASLPQRLLLCRELGHTWRPSSAVWDSYRECFERVLRCTRCRTDRHQTLTRWGHVLSSSYHYPEGYTTAGLGRLIGEDRDLVRLESITRTLTPEA